MTLNPYSGNGRRLWAALHLLDRQLVDRDGFMAGCVDDIELTGTEDGSLYVSAILSGPGVLANRIGAHRFGRWRRRSQQFWDNDGPDPQTGRDRTRIPFNQVQSLGSHITLAARHDQLASFAAERWAREQIIGRILGSDHAPQ